MKKAFISQEGKTAVLEYYNNLLKNFAIPYKTASIQTRFGGTFALCAGERKNPPLVLLHGSSMSSAMWIGDMAVLYDKYYVIAPDIPGEPGQSDERQLPLEGDDYAEWLLDLLNYFGLERICLVGNSLGGFLAAKFAIKYPQNVSKLVLLAPAGIGGQNPIFGEIAMRCFSNGTSGVDELLVEINGGEAIPETILNYQKLIFSAFNSRQEIIPIFSDDELKKLTMPCFIIVGGQDIMLLSNETAERATKLMPKCKVKMLPESGHSLVALTADILAFLQQPCN